MNATDNRELPPTPEEEEAFRELERRQQRPTGEAGDE